MKITKLDEAIKLLQNQIQGSRELKHSEKKCSWSKMEWVLIPVNTTELIKDWLEELQELKRAAK